MEMQDPRLHRPGETLSARPRLRQAEAAAAGTVAQRRHPHRARRRPDRDAHAARRRSQVHGRRRAARRPEDLPRRPGARRTAAGRERAPAAGRPQGRGRRAGRLPRLLGALQDRQAVPGLGRLPEGEGPRAARRARRPGRRLVGADRSRPGRAITSASPWPSTHDDTLWVVWSEPARPQLGPLRPALQGRQARRRGAADRRPRPRPLAPHDHRPARPGVAGLAGLPRRQVRHLRPLRRRRRLARRRSASAPPKANDWNPVVAADYKEDRVWVGWDTYDTGDYNVRVRSPVRRADAEARRRADAGGVAAVPGPSEPGLRPGRPALGRLGRVRAAMGQGHRLPLLQGRRRHALYAARAVRVRCLDRRQVARAGGGPL